MNIETMKYGSNEQKCFDILFQWECKAMQIYGNDKVKGFTSYFRISLSEDYFISFTKPFEVQIEIARDLIAHEKILNDNKEPSKEWIQKEIVSIINTLKVDLNKY